MSEPTPGPWRVDESYLDGPLLDVVAQGGLTVCGCGRPSEDNAEANARLIAAAPDLLAASVNLLDALYGPRECTHGNDGDEDICDGCAFQREKAAGLVASELRAAIAKAEGVTR